MPRSTQANNKTKASSTDVLEFLAAIPIQGRREDAHLLLAMMSKITGEIPTMWGPTIVGFGCYHYCYDSGREGDSFLIGFAPRKANMVIYIMPGFQPYTDILDKLGRFKSSKSCLYLGRLSGVNVDALATLIERSVDDMRAKYPAG